MNPKILSVRALEILDSRGNPTLKVFVALDNGVVTGASVPSGASTGENEACELRDGNSSRIRVDRADHNQLCAATSRQERECDGSLPGVCCQLLPACCQVIGAGE
jgi:hypothetical protein